MAERKPLASWNHRGVLLTPGTIQVINVDNWWRVSLIGSVSGESTAPRIAAEDAARAMVAEMAAALGGSVTWADAQEDDALLDEFRKRYDGALRGMAAHPVGNAQEASE